MTALSPIVSEFATTEQAEAHDQWFRAKVAASLSDLTPGVPHDDVMAEMQVIVRTSRGKRRSKG